MGVGPVLPSEGELAGGFVQLDPSDQDLSGVAADAAFTSRIVALATAATPTYCRYFDGTASNGYTTPYVAAYQISTSLDVRAAITPESWTAPGAIGILLSQGGVSANYGWQFSIDASGRPRLVLSTTGLVGGLVTAQCAAAPSVTAGSLNIVRALYDSTVPNVTFWIKSTSAATVLTDIESDAGWTQLGATVTASVPASVFASNGQMSAAMFSSGGTNPWTGRYVAALAKINGTTQVVLDGRNPGALVRGQLGRTWTLSGTASSLAPVPLA